MKKIIFCLVALSILMNRVPYIPAVETDSILQPIRTVTVEPHKEKRTKTDLISETYSFTEKKSEETKIIEKPEEAELYLLRDDVPLSNDEQKWLQDACNEFGVPYSMALGLIEKETDFRNVFGDAGASSGYMQVQKKWHSDRMDRLGVTDLMDPQGNFRVGLDYLSELYRKYNNWGVALTVYNIGYNPGRITVYANDVLTNEKKWEKTLSDDYLEKG